VKIEISRKAEKDLIDILNYISEKGYPETALNYVSRMEEFTLSLAELYNKYPLCRYSSFLKANFRCAVFENTYVFIYKVENNKLKVIRIIHGKT
jgi:plasmid stabilization system protein ParE